MANVSVEPTGAGSVVQENYNALDSRYGLLEECDFRAVANSGYVFDHFVVEYSTVEGGYSRSETVGYNPVGAYIGSTGAGGWFSRFTGDEYVSAITAYFVAQGGTTYTVTVAASPSVGGSVSGGGVYADGNICTLTATRASGWRFVKWEGPNGAVVWMPQHQFAVHANQSWTAFFSQLTGEILHGSGGGILHGSSGTILHDG